MNDLWNIISKHLKHASVEYSYLSDTNVEVEIQQYEGEVSINFINTQTGMKLASFGGLIET